MSTSEPSEPKSRAPRGRPRRVLAQRARHLSIRVAPKEILQLEELARRRACTVRDVIRAGILRELRDLVEASAAVERASAELLAVALAARDGGRTTRDLEVATVAYAAAREALARAGRP